MEYNNMKYIKVTALFTRVLLIAILLLVHDYEQPKSTSIVFDTEKEALGIPSAKSVVVGGELIEAAQWKELYEANLQDLEEFKNHLQLRFASDDMIGLVKEIVQRYGGLKNNIAVYCHLRQKQEGLTSVLMPRELEIIDRDGKKTSCKDPGYDEAYPTILLALPCDARRELLVAKIYHELAHIVHNDRSSLNNDFETLRKQEYLADKLAFEHLLEHNLIDSYMAYIDWIIHNAAIFDKKYNPLTWRHPKFSDRMFLGLIVLDTYLAAKGSSMKEFTENFPENLNAGDRKSFFDAIALSKAH